MKAQIESLQLENKELKNAVIETSNRAASDVKTYNSNMDLKARELSLVQQELQMVKYSAMERESQIEKLNAQIKLDALALK